MKIRLKQNKPILMIFGLLIGVFTILIATVQLNLFNLDDFFPTNDSDIVYGPVISDKSGGYYSVLWVTEDPINSMIKYDSGEIKMDRETRYHYYRLDSNKISSGSIELFHGKKSVSKENVTMTKADPNQAVDLPFVGYGEVQGLSQGEGFVIVSAGDLRFVTLVKDGRWSVDLPQEVKDISEGSIDVVKDTVLYTTDVNFKYVQPAQTIVLNLTSDRIKPQTSNIQDGAITGLVNRAYACEGDVGPWEITCPDDTEHKETDACTQDRFMATHDNGYDQWAFEACGCPLKGFEWEVECMDDTVFKEDDMCTQDLFYRVHNSNGFRQWQNEACQGHGGPKELKDDQEGASEREVFEKTPPTAANSQETATAKYICCWNDTGGSYAGETEYSNICSTGYFKVGEADSSSGCESQFSKSKTELEEAANSQTAPKPEEPKQNPFDEALAGEDLRKTNSNYPTKSDSLKAYCAYAFPDSVNYWSQLIVYWSEKYGLDPNAMAAIMSVESCGDPGATSSAGAMGLFQVMPFHFKAGEKPYDVDTNAEKSASFFKTVVGIFPGNMGRSFAGYNAGPWGSVGRSSNVFEWPSEAQSYYKLTTALYNDANSCGQTKEGYNYFWSQRGDGCKAAAKKINAGPTFAVANTSYQGSSTNNTSGTPATPATNQESSNVCFEPDTRGRCTTDTCDDQIGQSCTLEPDSCVYGGICIGGKCAYFPDSQCPNPDNYEEGSEDGGIKPQSAKVPSNSSKVSDNSSPVEVNSVAATKTYPVKEYNWKKNTESQYGSFVEPAEYVVLHWTAGGTTEGVVDFFKNNCPGKCTAVNYVVSKDGSLHYIFPLGQTLRHAEIYDRGDESISYINRRSLSFENMGTGDTTGGGANVKWTTVTHDQAMANAQEIIRHLESGDLADPSKLKVMGHFEVISSGNSDPGSEFVASVCKELHRRGYKVQCNWGVDASYRINDKFIKLRAGLIEQNTNLISSLISKTYAQFEGFDGPGMYNIEFDGYETQAMMVYMVKDLENTLFYEDVNNNGTYDESEQRDLYDKITKIEKVSNDIAVDMTNNINMVSFPVLPEGVFTAEDLTLYLNERAADIVSISRRNNGEWQTYQVRDGRSFSQDFDIEANEVYFIKLNYATNIILDASDKVDVGTQKLGEGWNMVVLPKLTSNPKVDEISKYFDVEGSIDSVFYWDGSKYAGISLDGDQVYGESFVLLENQPYWVRVSE